MTNIKNVLVDELKVGQLMFWMPFPEYKKQVRITNITKTRVMFDTNSTSSTSTGRSSSIAWFSKKTFQKGIDDGEFEVI